MSVRTQLIPGADHPALASRYCGFHKILRSGYLAAAVALFLTPATRSQETPKDLANTSIEDLMNIEVSTVSKKEQKLSQVAAAIFVITQDDISRSTAKNIPDLLRAVPGLQVAQINSNTWAISARGFNFQFANKLLVLIDGRAVYTPLFGGVNWDTVDVPLEDIERIEVIRGPGGTVWGANAVNGVINVITKKTADTHGAVLTGGAGTLAQGFGTAQYGGKIKQDTSYRAFAKYLNEDHLPNLVGQNAHDGLHLLHGGFRMDTSWSTKDSLTIQGDAYTGSEGATLVHSILSPPQNLEVQRLADISGGNLQASWNHTFSSRSDTTLQFYFDQYSRLGPESDEHRITLNFDFQHHLLVGARQDLIWGAGFRHTEDHTVGTIDQAFVPASQSAQFFNSFVQDQITLKPERLFLYLGTKLENSYFTGFDWDPSARLAWTYSPHATFWAAISRASRTPTRRDLGLNAVLAALPGPAVVVLLGNPKMGSEHVVAYELGYRAQPVDHFSIDVAAFFNVYHDLESAEHLPSYLDANSIPPLLVIPSSFANKLYGNTAGIESSLHWKVTNRWLLSPGYSFLDMHLHTDPSSLDTSSVADAQGSNPRHQAQLRSRLIVSHNFTWDANAYFVSKLPAQLISSYTRLDSQLTWRPTEHLQLSLVGQNLLKDHHPEFSDAFQSVDSSQVKRSVYAAFKWHF